MIGSVWGATGDNSDEQPAAAGRERARQEMVRLQPSAFHELSTPVRQELERRGCSIPQAFSTRAPHNVIRGRFTTPTQEDVAVLCSKERASSILVFRGGSAASVAELASLQDAGFLQVVGPDGAIGFSRKLAVADPGYIREHHERYGGPEPPALDHDGINDLFVEKASVVWYWDGGRWLQLTGAD